MPQPSPEQLHDLAVIHRIGLSRYSTAVVHKIIAMLNRIERDLVDRIMRSEPGLASERLEALLAELQAIQSAGWLLVDGRLSGSIAELAAAEAAFALRLAGIEVAPITGVTFSPVPPLEQIVAAVKARPFQGRFLRDWMAETDSKARERVRNIVRQGFVEGQTLEQIVQLLRGTRANRYQDGALEITRRGAEAMVRTALTHTANVAAQASWEANADIVLAWQFVATLDSRTTLTCAGLHGKQFELGKGPTPPRHINCRSTSVPVLDEIPGVKPFDFPSYDAWLRRQPVSVQNEVLGTAKAKLFREGGLTIDKFTDHKGKVLTLDELRRQDEEAFIRAGL